MRAHCSWCRAEGTPAYLGEREPLEIETDTYGVCARHMVQVLTAPRLRPPRNVQLLIVVALSDRSLYDYLSRGFATVDGVHVLLDRRQSERRGAARPVPWERRQSDRRQPRSIIQSMGATFVRFSSMGNGAI